MLLAGTGTEEDNGDGTTAAGVAAATQFFQAWGDANVAYGKAITAADIGLLRDGFSADFAHIDAIEAARETYWDAVDAADDVYSDALDAADEAFNAAERAAYERSNSDLADANAAFQDALSAASAVMDDAFGAAEDQFETSGADADAVRGDAYAAADSLVAAYEAAFEDAEGQYWEDVGRAYEALSDAQSAAYQAASAAYAAGDPNAWDAFYQNYDAPYAAFDAAVRAAGERRSQAEQAAEPLLDRYGQALTAADAAYEAAVAVAAEARAREEADASNVYAAAEAVAAAAWGAANTAASDRFWAALAQAYREQDAAYRAAAVAWDVAEKEAWDVQEEANGEAAFQWLVAGLEAEQEYSKAVLTASLNWWRSFTTAAVDTGVVTVTPPPDATAPEPPQEQPGSDNPADPYGIGSAATVAAGGVRVGRPAAERRVERRVGRSRAGGQAAPRLTIGSEAYFAPFIPMKPIGAPATRGSYNPYTSINVVGGPDYVKAYDDLPLEMQCMVFDCQGDPEREAAITKVFQDVYDTKGINRMYWFVGRAYGDDGFCGWWVDKFFEKYGGVESVSLADGKVTLEHVSVSLRGGGKITTAPNLYGYGYGLGFMEGHHVVKVTILRNDGSEAVMYADIGNGSPQGNFGGDEHWFFPDNPEWLRLIDVSLDRTTMGHNH